MKKKKGEKELIKAEKLCKKFNEKLALDNLDLEINDGTIFGLVGSNGSGKSTFLRLISGVYYADGGKITIDGEETYENIELKNKIFFVSDDFYFKPYSNLDQMAKFLSCFYENWDFQRYEKLCSIFPIDKTAKISSFSKGMKRQAALILGLSAKPSYLLLDEAFDGIDPVIRVALKKLLSDDVADRKLTVVISSHNLRELEDFCDHVGLLHKGKIMMEQDIDNLKLGFCKMQAIFSEEKSDESLRERLDLLKLERKNNLVTLIAKGSKEELKKVLEDMGAIYCDIIPLSLEEIFVYEMEAVGYDYNNIIF